jgi:hypothetical protein
VQLKVWAEWVESEYNTGGFRVSGSFISNANDLEIAIGIKPVSKDILINDGDSYNLV